VFFKLLNPTSPYLICAKVGQGNYSLGITALRLLRNDTYEYQDLFKSVDEEEGRGDWYTEEYNPRNTYRDRAGHKMFQVFKKLIK
jgi:hypothetical protein